MIKPGLEILAGIPSHLYGFIGFVLVNASDELSMTWRLLIAGIVVGVIALPTVVSVGETLSPVSPRRWVTAPSPWARPRGRR